MSKFDSEILPVYTGTVRYRTTSNRFLNLSNLPIEELIEPKSEGSVTIFSEELEAQQDLL